ncbi:MAG: ArsR family transcriptional regulator, partial [Myxococcales bacterium]|nr:ArsR family transcriptional regulator [Myxococcales bacterium]
AEIFKSLSDPTRLRILATLAEGDGACVHEICARVRLSQSAVSHQLGTLRAARLVRHRRAGREVIYSLDDEHVLSLITRAAEHAGHRQPPLRGPAEAVSSAGATGSRHG